MKYILAPWMLILCSTNLLAQSLQVPGIYGEDGRIDFFESRNEKQIENSLSVAAMIYNGDLKLNPNKTTYRPLGKSLKETGFCAEERFSHQVSAASCTGVLVAADIILTSGECVTNKWDCDNYSWSFDYYAMGEWTKYPSLEKDNLFHCKEIIAQKNDSESDVSYALIKLDRKTSSIMQAQLDLNINGEVNENESVYMIGNPYGLPLKIATGAQIISNDAQSFTTNVDAFSNNAGSPLFSEKTNKVIGILMSSQDKDVLDVEKGCRKIHKLSDEPVNSKGKLIYSEKILKLNAIPELKGLR